MSEEKRRMPVRTSRIELDGAWKGWWFEARTNVPLGLLGDFQSGNMRLITAALQEIVIDWNFVDEHGAPLFTKTYDANGNVDGQRPYVERIPPELWNAISAALYTKAAELPGE